MYKLHESEKEYRHGDHGPKYLEKGPRMNFGKVRLLPGEVVSYHVHEVMQENFFILEGTVTMTIEDTEITASVGDYVHLEPGEKHVIRNLGDVPVEMIVTAAPFKDGDKVVIE